MLTIHRTIAGDEPVEIERFASSIASDRLLVDKELARITNTLALASGRSATISLHRPTSEAAFTSAELEWFDLVHVGCAWIYAPAGSDASRRLTRLSPREREALGHLMRGASEKEVAALLNRSRHTIHSYVKRIYRTLGVCSRVELRATFGDALTTSDA